MSRAAVVVEANIFARLSRVIRSYIEGFVSSFEDPELVLDRLVLDMQADVVKMRQAAAQVIASERQLNSKRVQLQNQADQWLRRAELAVAKGEDDLAREALQRRKVYSEDAARIAEQLAMQGRASSQLQANIRVMEGKLAEAKTKRETLKARAASAKSSQQIAELIGGLRTTSSSSFAAFETMEQKVMEMEAAAESAAMLATPDSLENKFQMLEGAGGVEDELRALKRGVLPPPAVGSTSGRGAPARAGERQQQLPPGRPLADAIEFELEDLRRRVRE